jgi:hypothetical protein
MGWGDTLLLIWDPAILLVKQNSGETAESLGWKQETTRGRFAPLNPLEVIYTSSG